MSEANKLLLKRWFEQVWNQKSEAAIDEMFQQGRQVPRLSGCGLGSGWARRLQDCPPGFLRGFP